MTFLFCLSIDLRKFIYICWDGVTIKKSLDIIITRLKINVDKVLSISIYYEL